MYIVEEANDSVFDVFENVLSIAGIAVHGCHERARVVDSGIIPVEGVMQDIPCSIIPVQVNCTVMLDVSNDIVLESVPGTSLDWLIVHIPIDGSRSTGLRIKKLGDRVTVKHGAVIIVAVHQVHAT